MNRQILLFILLLAAASLAGAQVVTSGVVVDESTQVPYDLSGPNVSIAGVMDYTAPPPDNIVGGPFPVGTYSFLLSADTENPNLFDPGASVNGIPWALPTGGTDPGTASAEFSSGTFLITGPGIYKGTFDFSSFFLGVPSSVLSANPAADCDQLMCTPLLFSGGGTAEIDVVSDPNFAGSLDISRVTFTFSGSSNVPEPSTGSLLLIALAGLIVLGWRRKYRATLLLAA